MKMYKLHHLSGVILACIAGSHFPPRVTAEFRNLGFEESPFAPDAGRLDGVSVDLLFPHWTVRFDDAVQSTGSLNQIVLYGPQAALYTSVAPLVRGNKSLYLGAWYNTTASIAQQDVVPTGTESLRFLVRDTRSIQHPQVPGPFELRMNGQSVPLAVLACEDGNFTYGADIAEWAAISSEVRIGVTAFGLPDFTGDALIDAIEFSPDPIPEPGAGTLVGACILGLTRRRRAWRSNGASGADLIRK